MTVYVFHFHSYLLSPTSYLLYNSGKGGLLPDLLYSPCVQIWSRTSFARSGHRCPRRGGATAFAVQRRGGYPKKFLRNFFGI